MNALKSAVCVIIPFYQNTAEPLIRAIQSILDQQGVDRPQVLIVDDGSPLPAQPIIDENFPSHEEFIRIIVQKNSGAAQARNTGLDNVPESASFIAFLDSDDGWTPAHLSNAMRLFNHGCDFYFANYKRLEWEDDKFTRSELTPDQHRCIDETDGLYEFTGDILYPVMKDHLIATPTVVFRKHKMKDIRFPVDLVLGEDEVFWVKATRRAGKIGFCAHIEANETVKGVGISQGGDCGSEQSFHLLAQNIHFWKCVPTLLPTETLLDGLRKSRIRQLRRNLAESFWHNLRRGKGLPMQPIARFTITDPAWIFSLWSVLLHHLTSFFRVTRSHHE